jgi:hypothetical protein
MRLVYLLLIILLLLPIVVHAKNSDGRYDNAPFKDWYESQRNSTGQWCCNESDGHPYFGDYKIREDGGVILNLSRELYYIPEAKVLKGANPTGHAVWWYSEGTAGRDTYCFAPGTLS